MTDTIITIMTHTVITDRRTEETVPRQPPNPRKSNSNEAEKGNSRKENHLFLEVEFVFQSNHSEEGIFSCHTWLT